MKNIFAGILLFAFGITAGFSASVIAGDITNTGMYQKDLVTFLTNTVTAMNETKADFNAATAELNGAAAFDDVTAFTFGTVAASDLSLTGL